MVVMAIRVSPAATEAGADAAARMAALPGARGPAVVMPGPESYPQTVAVSAHCRVVLAAANQRPGC